MEWRHMVGNSIALVIGRGQTIVIFSGEVDDLDEIFVEERNRFEKELVDSGCSLTSACHE
jgi:hypothetical protein